MTETLVNNHKSSSYADVADISLADLHLEASLVRDLTIGPSTDSLVCKCCSMSAAAPLFPLSCNLISLGQLGVGFPLFFYTIKAFLIILTIGSLFIGIPCVVNNYKQSKSLENKPSNWPSESALHKGENPIWQSIIMFAYSIIILVSIIIFRKFIRRKIIEIDTINITPSDFAIIVKNLPYNTNFEDFRSFIEKNAKPFGTAAEVVGISPGYNISEYVKKVKKIKKLRQKILYVEEYKKNHGRLPDEKLCCVKKYSNLGVLERELKELQDWRKDFENTDNLKFEQGTVAFVIFRKQTDSKEIVDYWREKQFETLSRYTLMCLHKYMYSTKTYYGNILNIEQAPEPSDVIWENLTASTWTKLIKRLKTALITTILIIISFIVVLSIKIYEYNVYTNAGKNHISNSENMRIKAVSFLLSASIVTLNVIIGVAIRYFSRYEKPSTWTQYNISVFHKLVASTTLNTVILLILVNSYNIQKGYIGLSGVEVHWFSKEYGLASDLYNLFLIDAFVIPFFLVVNPVYLYTLFRRKKVRDGKIILNQHEANLLWTNPEIDVANRSARYLRTFLVALVFAPLFPLGLFLGSLSISIQYFTDKFLLLRRYSRPKNYSKNLTLAIIQWLPFCLIFFCISNFAVQYESHDVELFKSNGKGKYIIAPIFGIFISFIYFFIPFRKIFGKSIMAEETVEGISDPSDNDFYKQVPTFKEDYFRSNPAISHNAWEKWLNLIEQTQGLDAKNSIHSKYQNKIESSGLIGYASLRDSSRFLNSNRVCSVKNQFSDEDLNGRSSRGPLNSRYDFVPRFSYAPPGVNADAYNQGGLHRGDTGMNLGMQPGFPPTGGYGQQPPPASYAQPGYSNPVHAPQGYYPIQNQGTGNVPTGYTPPPLYQGGGPVPAGYNNLPYQGGPTVPPGYIPPGYNNPYFK